MGFDEITDRSGKRSTKWGMMGAYSKGPSEGAIPMWIADTDFRCPDFILDAARDCIDHGIFGYSGDYSDYFDACKWWMKTRHSWEIESDWIIPMHGLGNAIATALDTWADAGDRIVIFTPVYHEFSSKIQRLDQEVVECQLVEEHGKYTFDFDAYDQMMDGSEKILIFCSPHNPGGRVWSKEEIQGVCDFARRHDLLLISDEIHQDIVYGGNKHIPTAVADPSITDRLITVTAASKTFNIAGMRVGNTIISDPKLRQEYFHRVEGLGLQPNTMGIPMSAAAYSPEGAAWTDELVAYLNENRALFDAALNAIPGVKSINLEGTFLAWVDFSGTGMDQTEIRKRLEGNDGVIASQGLPFGSGGETFMRFNIGTPRAILKQAIERIQNAFSDLQ